VPLPLTSAARSVPRRCRSLPPNLPATIQERWWRAYNGCGKFRNLPRSGLPRAPGAKCRRFCRHVQRHRPRSALRSELCRKAGPDGHRTRRPMRFFDGLTISVRPTRLRTPYDAPLVWQPCRIRRSDNALLDHGWSASLQRAPRSGTAAILSRLFRPGIILFGQSGGHCHLSAQTEEGVLAGTNFVPRARRPLSPSPRPTGIILGLGPRIHLSANSAPADGCMVGTSPTMTGPEPDAPQACSEYDYPARARAHLKP
jgi:hypothetical protein